MPKPSKLISNEVSKGNSAPTPKRTERSRIQNSIANDTQAKRNAFIVAHEEFFAPLLPEVNYLTKLQHLRSAKNDPEAETSPYVEISQPKGVLATMKDYQLEGLSFLVSCMSSNMNTPEIGSVFVRLM